MFRLELEAVAQVRAELGSILPSGLHRFDESVRSRSEWNGWTGALACISPPAVRMLARLSKDPEAVAVALAAQSSGWLREAALPLLAEQKTPLAVGMLLLRTADWVSHVRRVAQQMLLRLIDAEGVDALLPSLPLLEQQAATHARTHDFARQLMERVLCEATKVGLRVAIRDPDRRVRRSAARLLVAGADAVEAVSDALSQDDPVTLAIIAVGAVESAPRIVLEVLCAAPVPRVRAVALDRFLRLVEEATGNAVAAHSLLDRATSVRDVAQDFLRSKGVDVPGIYIEKLTSSANRATVETALRGLVETGSRQHATVLLRFAAHSSARVRDAVCVGFGIWESAARKDVLAAFLSDRSRRVAARAGHTLVRIGLSPADLEHLWRCAVTREDDALLSVFAALSRWTQVVFGLRGVQTGSDTRTVAFSEALLSNVVACWNQAFTAPSASQRKEIAALVQSVDPAMSEHLRSHLMLSLRPFLLV